MSGQPGRVAVFWLVMLLGTALAILAGGELVARQIYTLELPVAIGRGETMLTEDENRLGFRADPELIWRLRKNVRFPDEDRPLRGIVSNAQAVREPATIPRGKAPNELRILFLGDSITFGWRVLHDETFSSLTAQALRERFPGVAVTPVNAGVPAHSLLQGWRLLVTQGFDFEPDLVVLGSFGFNDSRSWLDISDFEQLERWRARMPIASLQWSRLAQLIANKTHRAVHPPSEVRNRPRLYPSEFSDLLERIRAATEAAGVELLVVVPGHEYNLDGTFPEGTWGPYQRVLVDFGRTLRLGPLAEPAVVDGSLILQELAREHEFASVMFDYVHPTPVVHAALADALVSRIAPWVETQFQFGRFAVNGARP